MAGKGHKRRPQSVPMNEFDNNWDLAFGKKKKKWVKGGMKPSGKKYKSVSELLADGPHDHKEE